MRGVWIEILYVGAGYTQKTMSLPMRGVWIEILGTEVNGWMLIVTPHAGSVD